MLLGAVATAFLAGIWLPGTAIDRVAFTTVARGFANPPFFIAGNGSHASPWKLRTFAANNLTDKRQAPVIVSLGDDPDGFFQSSPPSPIDLAVILSNFQRLGAHQAATAVVLAWESPDPIGLAALDKALSRFDSLVMAAPLARGAVPEQIPPAFRKASVPLETLRGDPSALPVVNRIPLTGIILGKDNTAAGFQVLDSEPTTRFAPLLARWEDRVVFAFPLLTVLQRLELPVEGVEIRLGEYLKLGPNGPIMPIDRYGRLALPLKALAPYAAIPAAALIDGANGLLPHLAPQPAILRDDRSAAEPATRAFSQHLPALISALASDTGLAPAHNYPRLQPAAEYLVLLLVAIALAALCGLSAFPRNIGFLTLSAAALAAQYLAAGSASLWLPGLPALAAMACAWLLSGIIALTPPVPLPLPALARPPRRSSKPIRRLPPRPAPQPAPASVETPPMPAPQPAPTEIPPIPEPQPVPVETPPIPAPQPAENPSPKKSRPRAKKPAT